jgi:NitT/TauT family transport system permease protein
VALMQAFKGAREVDTGLVQVAQSFGASRRQVFLKVVIPSAAVWVVNAFRLNVGFALLGAFLGEFISSSHGLGHLILVAQGLQNIPLVLVGVSVISLLGLVLTWTVDALERPIKHLLAKAF